MKTLFTLTAAFLVLFFAVSTFASEHKNVQATGKSSPSGGMVH